MRHTPLPSTAGSTDRRRWHRGAPVPGAKGAGIRGPDLQFIQATGTASSSAALTHDDRGTPAGPTWRRRSELPPTLLASVGGREAYVPSGARSGERRSSVPQASARAANVTRSRGFAGSGAAPARGGVGGSDASPFAPPSTNVQCFRISVTVAAGDADRQPDMFLTVFADSATGLLYAVRVSTAARPL